MITQFNAHRGNKKLSLGYVCCTKDIYLTYFDLEIRGNSINKEVISIFNSKLNWLQQANILYQASNKEELIDLICGNTWPEEMEEFLQLIVQELTI